jgi:signal transduction histidine kinase
MITNRAVMTVTNNLQSLISDTPNPVFIIDVNDRHIFQVNDVVVSIFGERNPVGKTFDNVVYANNDIENTPLIFLGDQWYDLRQEAFLWEGDPYLKVILKRPECVVDPDSLHIIRNMCAVLVHRFRSPLTGMQGQLEWLGEDIEIESDLERLGKVNEGVDRLFDILDELELLHNVPLQFNCYDQAFSINPEVLIQEILLNYPSGIRERIKYSQSSGPFVFNCNPQHLKRVLSALLENAVEHCLTNNHTIDIDIPSRESIRISHGGQPIPKEIADRLFYPFVTSKANNLGIGLTLALLYAEQLQGTIRLTNNSLEEGISFTLCLPPQSTHSA